MINHPIMDRLIFKSNFPSLASVEVEIWSYKHKIIILEYILDMSFVTIE